MIAKAGFISSTKDRVPDHTDACVNAQIRAQTERNIARYMGAGEAAITQRLRELDEEWDIERTLEANASTAVLIGVTLGALKHRGFFVLPALVAGFLLQHAVQGWCPPMPILRRLGFRTANEIDYERYALKAFRGDFQGIPETVSSRTALAAAER
jgi:hypothetical protein